MLRLNHKNTNTISITNRIWHNESHYQAKFPFTFISFIFTYHIAQSDLSCSKALINFIDDEMHRPITNLFFYYKYIFFVIMITLYTENPFKIFPYACL